MSNPSCPVCHNDVENGVKNALGTYHAECMKMVLPPSCPCCGEVVGEDDAVEMDGEVFHADCVADDSDDSDSFDDSMDGDHESALASVGWGCDEDYGYYGDDGGDWLAPREGA